MDRLINSADKANGFSTTNSGSVRIFMPLDISLCLAGIFLLTVRLGKITGNLYISDILIFCSFLIVLSKNLISGRLFLFKIMLTKSNPFRFPFILLTLAFMVSLYRSPNLWENFTRYIQFAFTFTILFPLIFYYINYRAVSTKIILLTFFSGELINLATMLLYAFFGYAFMDSSSSQSPLPAYAGVFAGRYTIFGNEPNEVARLLVLPVAFLWYFIAVSKTTLKQILVWMFFLAIFIGVMLTVSKTGFAIIFISLVMYFVIDRPRLRISLLLASLAIAGYAGVIYLDKTLLKSRPIIERFIEIQTGQETSVSFRIEQYSNVLSDAHKYLIAGLGFDNPFSGIHNVILESLVDLGGLGVIAFSLFYAIPIFISWHYLRVLKRSRRTSRELILFMGGFLIGCVSLFIGDMFMTYSIERSLWLIPIMAVSYGAFLHNNPPAMNHLR